MLEESKKMETFPVLIGDEVAHFHDISGGYATNTSSDIFNFIQEVQGPGRPYRVNTDELPHTVEAHMSENYYYLELDGIRATDEYPSEDYVLSLKVNNYSFGPHSFSEPLTEPIDGRETKYE
jgi:hypothetical protein